MRIVDWISDVCSSDLLLIEILRHRYFRHLFLAQVVALVGTGLATVALALLAYDLAGDRAGAVLGTALAIKMAVYVVISPLAGALVTPRHRKRVLVVFDLIRAVMVLALPFVPEIWQVYLDRKSVVSGKSVSVRVDLGGRRIINKKLQTIIHNRTINKKSIRKTS